MNFRSILFLLFTLPFFMPEVVAQSKFKLKTGDLLFQDLDCGGLCDAIESVTTGYKSATFSHVGVVKISESGEVQVLEAIGPNVHYTPLQAFLNRQLDAEKKPKVAVGRLRKKYKKLIPEAIVSGEKLLGKPYDDVFAIDNDAYYCSELVYKIYRETNTNQPVFSLAPMTYNDPETGKLMPVWQNYFSELKTRVPQNDPGLNPGGISCSNKLKIYFPYGKPDRKKPVK